MSAFGESGQPPAKKAMIDKNAFGKVLTNLSRNSFNNTVICAKDRTFLEIHKKGHKREFGKVQQLNKENKAVTNKVNRFHLKEISVNVPTKRETKNVFKENKVPKNLLQTLAQKSSKHLSTQVNSLLGKFEAYDVSKNETNQLRSQASKKRGKSKLANQLEVISLKTCISPHKQNQNKVQEALASQTPTCSKLGASVSSNSPDTAQLLQNESCDDFIRKVLPSSHQSHRIPTVKQDVPLMHNYNQSIPEGVISERLISLLHFGATGKLQPVSKSLNEPENLIGPTSNFISSTPTKSNYSSNSWISPTTKDSSLPITPELTSAEAPAHELTNLSEGCLVSGKTNDETSVSTELTEIPSNKTIASATSTSSIQIGAPVTHFIGQNRKEDENLSQSLTSVFSAQTSLPITDNVLQSITTSAQSSTKLPVNEPINGERIQETETTSQPLRTVTEKYDNVFTNCLPLVSEQHTDESLAVFEDTACASSVPFAPDACPSSPEEEEEETDAKSLSDIRTAAAADKVHSGVTSSSASLGPLSRRNARERNRVRQVSQGFAVLRQHVPQANRRKKLSKVETLRCAVDYIKALTKLIEDSDAGIECASNYSPRSQLSSGHLNNTSNVASQYCLVQKENFQNDEPPNGQLLFMNKLQEQTPRQSTENFNYGALQQHPLRANLQHNLQSSNHQLLSETTGGFELNTRQQQQKHSGALPQQIVLSMASSCSMNAPTLSKQNSASGTALSSHEQRKICIPGCVPASRPQIARQAVGEWLIGSHTDSLTSGGALSKYGANGTVIDPNSTSVLLKAESTTLQESAQIQNLKTQSLYINVLANSPIPKLIIANGTSTTLSSPSQSLNVPVTPNGQEPPQLSSSLQFSPVHLSALSSACSSGASSSSYSFLSSPGLSPSFLSSSAPTLSPSGSLMLSNLVTDASSSFGDDSINIKVENHDPKIMEDCLLWLDDISGQQTV